VNRSIRNRIGAALALTLAAAAASAQAVAAPDPGPRLWLKMVGHAAKIESSARIDEAFGSSPSSVGTTIDVERELGPDDKKLVGNLEFGVRLGERWRIEVEYLQARRGGSSTLGRAILFDGLTFAQGSPATSEHRVTFTRVNAGFAFVRQASAEVGVAFGGSSIDHRLTLRARPAGAAPGSNAIELTRADAVVMPTVGVYARARLAPDWNLLLRAYGGRINSGSAEGAMADASALAAWDVGPNFRLLAGWRLLDLRAEPKISGIVFTVPLRSVFRTRLDGPLVQGELRF
jgi:hypothetical protein